MSVVVVLVGDVARPDAPVGPVLTLEADGTLPPGTRLPPGDHASVRVVAQDVASLRRSRPVLAALGECLELVLQVPALAVPGAVSAAAPVVRNRRVASTTYDYDTGTVAVEVSTPAAVTDLLALLLPLRGGHAVLGGRRVVLGAGVSGAWTAGLAGVLRESVPGEDADAAAVDRVATPEAELEVTDEAGVVGVQKTGGGAPGAPRELGREGLPPVDVGVINPFGFRPATRGDLRLLTKGAGTLVLRDGQGKDVVRFLARTGPGEVEVAAVRHHRAVVVRPVGAEERGNGPGPVQDAGGPVVLLPTVAALACAGVPLQLTPDLLAGVATDLGPAVHQELLRCAAADLTDDYEREVRSVALRRAALLSLSVEAVWGRLAQQAGWVVPALGAGVSVVLATRRSADLPHALEQLAAQTHPDVELVLALHGLDPDQVRHELQRYPRPLTLVTGPAEQPFGELLNVAVARASGDVIVKMDDDDWYGPDHVTDLVLARRYSGADVVGTFAELFYLEGLDVTVRRTTDPTEAFAHRTSGSTMSVRRHVLQDTGGFAPVPRQVDTLTIDRLVAAGASVYVTHGLGHVVRRRAAGHTWDPGADYFLRRTTRQWAGRPSLEHVGDLAAGGPVVPSALTSLELQSAFGRGAREAPGGRAT